MAEIFLARPTNAKTANLDDVLVLKRILPHLAEDEHFVTMFRDEAELAGTLLHKNICHVSGFGEYAGTWFIAMEYLHGVPLSRMMTRLSKAGKMLDVRLVAGIIVQACEGLHAAHEARGPDGALLNVVHRDVSPPNIMVTDDGMVKLLDFGIAKARGANSRTRTGTVKGKNAYMSPEQILGKPLDRRSDVFALAVVMYEMLAIRRLFHRDSDFLTFKAITEEPIPEIRDRRPDLPAGMRAALLQAMARDPNGRFDTAQAFGNAIKNSVATLGGIATPEELGRLLAGDFSDEMAARDEILKAAEDPAMLAAPNAPMSGTGTAPMRGPPPLPLPLPPPPRHATSGEFDRRSSPPSVTPPPYGGNVPSMMVSSESSRVEMPLNAAPVAMGAVPDFSATVPVDTWMASPDTNLLRAHRWKSLRNGMIVIGVLAVAIIGIVIFGASVGGSSSDRQPIVSIPIDAGVRDAPPPIDAPPHHDDIVALSHYGFFSITASAATTIYMNDTIIGKTPLTRVPMKPGIYQVKAVGPHGKHKEIKVTIIAAQDSDEGTITW